MRNNIAHDRERVFVILGHMIDHARFTAMQVAAAQILGANLFTRCGLDQWRACQEDSALITNNDALIRHCRNICATSGTTAHDTGDLRDALGAHICLVEEDAPEMVTVGKNLVLMRQIRTAAVDQIDAWQMVRLGDFLRPQMLFDRHRVISTTLYRRVITNNHALAARNTADSRD